MQNVTTTGPNLCQKCSFGETKEMFSYTYTSLRQQLALTKSSDKTTTTYKENRRGVSLCRLDEICMLLLLGLRECR